MIKYIYRLFVHDDESVYVEMDMMIRIEIINQINMVAVWLHWPEGGA